MIELLSSIIVAIGIIVASIWVLSKITIPLLKALVSLIALIIFAGIISVLGLAIISMGIYAFLIIGFIIILLIINFI